MSLIVHPSALSQSFQVSASYLPSNLESVDPYVNSTPWSRRFLGVRLFLALAKVGWDGHALPVEHSVALLQRLAGTRPRKNWRIANDPRVGVLCLRPPERDLSPGEIVTRIVTSGKAWISVARLEGMDVIRVCLTNDRTDEYDIDALATLSEPGAG